jgi:uncharacterized membrane protein
MRDILFAVGRFLGFFFVLMLTVTVLIAAYSAVASAPISQTWDAVKALVITAVVLLLLALGCGLIADGMTASRDRNTSDPL